MRDDVKGMVRGVAERYIEAAHPQRKAELEATFDVAFEQVELLDSHDPGDASGSASSGLPFDASLLDLSLVGFAVVSAFQLVQLALLRQERGRVSELARQLREAVAGIRGLPAPRREELRQIADLVAQTIPPREPEKAAELVGVRALQLLVLRRDRAGHPLLEFRLHGRMGERSYGLRSFGERALSQEPERYFEELFAQIVTSAQANEEQRRAGDAWVRRRGAYLFELFLPEPLQAELRWLARTGGDLLVISEEPWIPWELLKFPAKSEDGEARFLAEAFALARWLPGTEPPSRLPLRRIALVRSQRSDIQGAEEEAAFLLAQADPARRRVEPVAAHYLELTHAMASGEYDAWHVIAHGARSRAGAEWAELALDDRVMNPQDLSDEVAAGLEARRPFVFLNACHVGGAAPGLVGVGGWPPRFLEVGAGAFLGPLWAVPGDRAAVFARLFYERLLAGETIGGAVRGARLALHERFPGDPVWLAYSLYAAPGAVCVRSPADQAARSSPAPRLEEYQGKAWSDKRESKILARRLSTLSGEEYEALVVRLLRSAIGAWQEELSPLGGGLWALGIEPPYEVGVLILHFEARGEELGAEEAALVREALESIRRSAVGVKRLILVHNRHGGSEAFRREATAALGALRDAGRLSAAELWDYQQLLRRAFGGMLYLLVSESRRRSLSLETVTEVLRRASWQDEPLESVPMRTSTLVADQYRLVGEEGPEVADGDPAAIAVAGEERSITLLLGAFGFGKTTTLARALLGHEREVFFVPAAGISEEVHGAKDLLAQCVDLDRLLEGVPGQDQGDYRLLARPVVEYAFKQKEIDAVLVLDGLDESPFLSRPGGLQNLVNNLWDLRVPVVLSMRTEFWEDKLADFEASFGDRAAHGERRVRRIRKLELLPWRDEQIVAFLEAFRGSVGEEAGKERIGELASRLADGRFGRTYREIPRRPFFLRMIAETVAAQGLPGGKMGRARLLADAARVKIERDVTAPRRAGGAGRPSILGRPMSVMETLELSWRAMVVAASRMTRFAGAALELLPDCSFEAVRDSLPRLGEVDDPLPLVLHSLLRLTGPRTGRVAPRLRFAHRAFQEFFLAWHLVESEEWPAASLPAPVVAWIEDLRREGLVERA